LYLPGQWVSTRCIPAVAIEVQGYVQYHAATEHRSNPHGNSWFNVQIVCLRVARSNGPHY
jgi:hypothetical protein